MTPPKPISEQAYPFAEVESRWQLWWEENGIYKWGRRVPSGDEKTPPSPPAQRGGGSEGASARLEGSDAPEHFTPPSPPGGPGGNAERPKHYVLVMFSYPSGDKLHMGHWYNFGPTDSYARFKRMQGYDVFEPMGFDSFGLPAENYAIKTGIHPAKSTANNIKVMREQLKKIGAMYDWDYEVVTSSPDYYKWTQWWFLLMYKRGLAYQKDALVNWCPNCQTVLANEQVTSDNLCERCDSLVERRKMRQWFFRISDYNQRLLDGLDTIDWPEKTKAMQRYWIGKSEGTEISFKIGNRKEERGNSEKTPPNPPAQRGGGSEIRVFTTRADTLFGVTYVVMAPEHPLVKDVTTDEQRGAVEEYVQAALSLSEVDRQMEDRPKTGVFTGAYAIHPLTGDSVTVWVADYVIGSYGTGAVMAVPAHDTRDFAFAKTYGLPIKEVIRPDEKTPPSPPAQRGGGSDSEAPLNPPISADANGGRPEAAFTEYGVMFDSGEFSGLSSKDGIKKVGEKLKSLGLGEPTVTWHLRDWTVSRQRYWGAPIPMVHCEKCGTVPVPEDQLPVLLPENVEEYKPKGKSPLASVESFIKTSCPQCGGAAERDPDTMDTFVCSSWYYLRYPDAHLSDAPFDREHLKNMFPVDQYVGGPEHAMGHLIYSRFFAKVAKDAGWFPYEEPFSRLIHQGIILNNGERMSKSKGNTVAPEPVLERVGSDVLRCYLMFSGDYTQGGDWSEGGISGIERFVARVWRLGMAVADGKIEKSEAPLNPPISADVNGGRPEDAMPRDVERKLHQTIQAVGHDLQGFAFNTQLARLMELTNTIYGWVGSDLKDVQSSPAKVEAVETLVKLIAPSAPHLAEELWHVFGHLGSIFDESWPEFDAEKAKADTLTIAVQINGKLRETFEAAAGATKDELEKSALELDKIKAQLEGKQLAKVIVVPGKIVNLVVKG
ncbi:MAG: leucine--tRNA ligase [Calditrichaeota bacterium]|nr:leucine--tRNA ligase [Calditrichota bacterium]MCB9368333.1 leucine--tRNA ligase [Calditrichota bacterium]